MREKEKKPASSSSSAGPTTVSAAPLENNNHSGGRASASASASAAAASSRLGPCGPSPLRRHSMSSATPSAQQQQQAAASSSSSATSSVANNMASALCYCIHDTLDSGEEMSIAGEDEILAPVVVTPAAEDAEAKPKKKKARVPGVLTKNMSLPMVMVQGQARVDSPPIPRRGRKKKKKSSRSASTESSGGAKARSASGEKKPPVPTHPPPSISILHPPNEGPGSGAAPGAPPPQPPMIVQVLPPTPTSPIKTPMGTQLPPPGGGVPALPPTVPSPSRPTLPLLNLPEIYLPANEPPEEDDDETLTIDTSHADKASANPPSDLAPFFSLDSASNLINNNSVPPPTVPAPAPVPVPPCEIRIECEAAAQDSDPEPPPTPSAESKRARPRRRSLVAMLFLPKSQAQESATTPTLEAPQGQRLHFRRVSEIFSRMGSSSKDSDEPETPSRVLHSHLGHLKKCDNGQSHFDDETPATPPDSCGLSVRNLFPFRRRKSSLTHLDNTDQFKESREEIIQNTRRRMSSFPPMDGDEAAIMLEKANVIRLEQAHQEALALQSGNSLTNAFRRLRRGSRSPSPMSLFPGVSKAKKSKWKSSTDINSVEQQQRAGVEQVDTPPLFRKESPAPAQAIATPPTAAAPKSLLSRQCSQPAALAGSTVLSNANSHSTGSMSGMAVVKPEFPDVPDVSEVDGDLGLTLPPPLSPLRIGPCCAASAFASASSAAAYDGGGGGGAAGGDPQQPQSAAADAPRRPLFVFPKRRVEDVPGIFIPKNKPVRTKTTEDADSIISAQKSTNLLQVMKDKPRRHSMSDPIFLQNYAAQHSPRPLLLPRSPYSHDGGGALSWPRSEAKKKSVRSRSGFLQYACRKEER